MFACVAVLLLALSASEVSAQATHQYDIANCGIYKIAEGTHHAENPNDCRTFYNCDANNGGKLVFCPEGLVYNPDKGICVVGGDCNKWYTESNCAVNSNGVGRFPARCCKSYYEYYCSTRTYKFMSCGTGQGFNANGNANSRSCVASSTCQPCINTVVDPCLGTHMVYASDCQYRVTNTEQVIRCPDGTAFSNVTCRCDWDLENKCPITTVPPGCPSKRTFNFATRLFLVNTNAPVVPYTFLTQIPVPLYNLQGQDFGYKPFSMKLRFTLQSTTQLASVLTADTTCSGFKLEVKVLNGNSIQVTATNKGRTLMLQANVNVGVNSEITLKVVFDLKGRSFQATANGITLQPSTNVATTMLSFASDGLDVYCLHSVGPISGRVSELAFWRDCTQLASLN
ncbi:uncharacterized protein LOC143286448 [Babylonia areolata]|uniref:uncharacterized protein LOC143286448 n=1 Tax=Babylonia areolata TaxID=304850 RepID=UPI003FD482B8